MYTTFIIADQNKRPLTNSIPKLIAGIESNLLGSPISFNTLI